MHYRLLAEKLMKKYSHGKYRPWMRRKRIHERIRYFHRKARNIAEYWAKKTALKIDLEAKRNSLAVAREDLKGLVEALRELPKTHRVRMIVLSYRRLIYWIDWQAEKHGVKVVAVEPKGTSTTCPRCGNRLVANGYKALKYSTCGFEDNRDVIALLNI